VRAASDLLKPCDARLMRCYPISTRINHVTNDDAECSAPVELAQMQDSTVLVVGGEATRAPSTLRRPESVVLETMIACGGCLCRTLCGRGVDDNIRSRAVDNRFQFRLLGGGDGEFVQRLLKIVQECLPLLSRLRKNST